MTTAGPSGNGPDSSAPVQARETAARSPQQLVFGDEGVRRLRGRERELLPRQVLPAALRWTWIGLVVILLTLAGIATAIGRVLW